MYAPLISGLPIVGVLGELLVTSCPGWVVLVEGIQRRKEGAADHIFWDIPLAQSNANNYKMCTYSPNYWFTNCLCLGEPLLSHLCAPRGSGREGETATCR